MCPPGLTPKHQAPSRRFTRPHPDTPLHPPHPDTNTSTSGHLPRVTSIHPHPIHLYTHSTQLLGYTITRSYTHPPGYTPTQLTIHRHPHRCIYPPTHTHIYIHRYITPAGRGRRIGSADAAHAELGRSVPCRVKSVTYKIDTCRILAWHSALIR